MIAGVALYEYMSCPYCARVRNALAGMGLEVESRDIQLDRQRLQELIDATGRTTVPCLRIESDRGVEWMHESRDIIRYFEERVAEGS